MPAMNRTDPDDLGCSGIDDQTQWSPLPTSCLDNVNRAAPIQNSDFPETAMT